MNDRDTVASVGAVLSRSLPLTYSNKAIKKFRHALSLDEVCVFPGSLDYYVFICSISAELDSNQTFITNPRLTPRLLQRTPNMPLPSKVKILKYNPFHGLEFCRVFSSAARMSTVL